jgi:hypothetical protein
MSVEDFLKNPKTVEIVLSSLGRKVTLPNEGFLAGGSVANMLLSLYHKGTPCMFKVNDVDIFNVVDPNSIDAEMLNGEGEELLKGDVHLGSQVMDMRDAGYGHVYVERDGTYYRIMSAERDGLINDIKCFVSHGEYGGETIRVTPEPLEPGMIMVPVTYNEPIIPNIDPSNDIILRGFDLNCCQVGIDLSNGVLHYTDSFVKFLKSKQVLVDLPYTPLHTAIRLVKKMEMYGDFCYCDIDYEMNYLYQATGTDEACMFFGKENYDKFITHHEILQDYIEIKSVEIKNMPHEYRKKYFPNSFKVLNKPIGDNMTTTPTYGNYVETEMVEGRELWTYEFVKGFKYIPDEFTKMWELKKIWDFKYRHLKKSHKQKIDIIMSYGKKNLGLDDLNGLVYTLEQSGNQPYPTQCLMIHDYYYKCDFTEEHLDEIVGFVNDHRRLGRLLSKANNVQEQYNNVKMIKSLAKQEGQWIIGTLETLGGDEMVKGTVITKEWVEGLIEKEKQRMSTPLVEPINLDKFKYKDCVTELVRPLDLKMEGEKMGHCVGGYSHNIERGESRIFHIEVAGIGSTLEIGMAGYPEHVMFELNNHENRKTGKKEFRVKQHQGRYPEIMGNQTPTNKNRGIAFKLCYFLANEYLSDERLQDIEDSVVEDVKNREIRERIKAQELMNCVSKSTNVSVSKRNLWSNWLRDYHGGKNNPKNKRKTSNVFDDIIL